MFTEKWDFHKIGLNCSSRLNQRKVTTLAKKQNARGYKGGGSITKLDNGKYQIRVTIGKDHEGKQIRKSKNAPDIKTAKRYLSELLETAGLNSGIDPKTPLYIAVKTHYETFRKPSLSESSIEIYDSILDRYIKTSDIAGISIDQINTHQIQKLLNDVGQTKGKETVKRVKSMLSGPLVIAHDRGAIRLNPMSGVKIMGAANTARKEKPKWLTEDQQRKLIEYCHKEERPRFRTISAMALSDLATGLRIGELCALRDEDVDLNAGVIQVRQTLKRRKKGLQTNIPKTESSIREVPILYFALPILKRYKQFRDGQAENNSLYQPCDLFFRTSNGGPIDPRNATKSLQNLFGHLGIGIPTNYSNSDYGFHELRHTFATRMLESEINPKVVQELLGHSSIEITLGIYSHVSVQTKEAAIKKVSNLYPLPEGIAE